MGQRRQRGAVLGGLAVLGFVACGGSTTQRLPDEAMAVGGSGVASGGSAQSAGGTPTSAAGKAAATSGTSSGVPSEPPSFGGAPPELPSGGGATPVAGGAASPVGGAPPETGGAPPSVPSSGGAPSCDAFEEAWLTGFCDTFGDATPDNCGSLCSPQVGTCLAKCGDCSNCASEIACKACVRARVACKARCASLSAACNDKCIRYGEQCDTLEAQYPDCERPPVTTAP